MSDQVLDVWKDPVFLRGQVYYTQCFMTDLMQQCIHNYGAAQSLHVTSTSSVLYLCVIHESSSSVT